MTIAFGDIAPDAVLAAAGGGEVSLSKLRGRPVVLYFYPKADTSGCTQEAIDFTRLKPAFEQAGAAVIGVSGDPVKALDRFAAKHALGVQLASGDQSLFDAYGVWVEKSMYGRKYMGIERATFLIGKDGRVAQVWRKVKVPGHADEVLAAVKALD